MTGNKTGSAACFDPRLMSFDQAAMLFFLQNELIYCTRGHVSLSTPPDLDIFRRITEKNEVEHVEARAQEQI